MTKKILVVSGHPKPDSLCEHLADTYAKAAGESHSVRLLKLCELEFEPN